MQNEHSSYSYPLHFNHSMQKFEDYWNAILLYSIILFFPFFLLEHHSHFLRMKMMEIYYFHSWKIWYFHFVSYNHFYYYYITSIISRICLRFSNFLPFGLSRFSQIFHSNVYCNTIILVARYDTYLHAIHLCMIHNITQ